MKRALYGERDYAFGQRILTLRTQMSFTQAGLAEHLHVSRRAITEWEAGSSYPKTGHLQALIALGVQNTAFPAGHEAKEIRTLWQAAHQKVLLDEVWLGSLLNHISSAPNAPQPVPLQAHHPDEMLTTQSHPKSQLDWKDAPTCANFYGRELELATLTQWVVEEGCRVVSVLGMGGMGKSALAVRTMQQLAEHFDVVLFRSLRDIPSSEALLTSCLSVLVPESLALETESQEYRLNLLLAELHRRRILLVFDNLEVLLEEEKTSERLHPGFEAYKHLLQQVARTEHQSCLLLSSREKPAILRALEGRRTHVRSLRLSGLETTACEQLLAEHDITGTLEEQNRLREMYGGNPLALKIVAETIADLFGGEIKQFLSVGTTIFGGITELLEEQWVRLSSIEQTMLYWLATVREPAPLDDLLRMLVVPLACQEVLDAVDSLHRRSLIERGPRPGSFTLHSVVLEYVTNRLIVTASEEIQHETLSLLRQHSLLQAQAKQYVQQTQARLLLTPLLVCLQRTYQGRAEVETQLLRLLDTAREQDEDTQGYGPANLIALLKLLRGNLSGLDLSRLSLREASLQGVEMNGSNLCGTVVRECVFSEAFDAITATAISPDGHYWAAANRQGEIRVWTEAGQVLHRVWQAHTDNAFALIFSPDGHTLASGSHDGSVKLWDVEANSLLWSGWHTKGILSMAFSPDGSVLASGGLDATVRFWNARHGTLIEDIPHSAPIFALAWSSDGRLLASGDLEGKIRLWEMQKTQMTTSQVLEGHSSRVRGLTFSPDSNQLASASYDDTINIWEVGQEGSPHLRQTLPGHKQGVQSLTWSPDGGTLASSSLDCSIRLWKGEQHSCRAILQGHSAVAYGLTFTPDSHHLLSGSDDSTLRLWDVESGALLRVMQSHTHLLYDVAWSPDGSQLASVGSDGLVTVWKMFNAHNTPNAPNTTPSNVLHGHRRSVYGVAWSPDGRRIATGGVDQSIRLWNATTGMNMQVLRDDDGDDTIYFGLAWSPDGQILASGTLLKGVFLWNMTTGSHREVERIETSLIRYVVWSPDGTLLVGIGNDHHVYVWDANGILLQRLAGHQGLVTSVTWSPDGTYLASGSGSSEGSDNGEIFVWEAYSGRCVHTVAGHPGVVSALAWVPDSCMVVSGGSDGKLRWWDMKSGACVQVQKAHEGMVMALKMSLDGETLASCGGDGAIILWNSQSGECYRTLRRDRLYERLNITGMKGLTPAQRASLRALGAIENYPPRSDECTKQIV